MRLLVLLICFTFAFGSGSVRAEMRMDLWHVTGAEARVCNQPDGGSCVTLTCAADGRLIMQVNGGGLQPGPGQISVDGRVLGTATFGGQQGFAAVSIDPQQNAQVLRDMGAGSRMGIEIAGWFVDVSLGGSAASIAEVTELCTRAPPDASTVAEATLSGAYERRQDESAVSLSETSDFGAFSLHRDLDIWGGDLRSGLDDPRLRNIDQSACAMLCLATEGCGAFTHNQANGNVCFLKTGAARMTAFAGAVTGVRAGLTVQHVPPPTPGPLPVADETVVWQAGDSDATHAARARQAAVPLAESCEAERAGLARLAEDFQMALPEGTATAGDMLRVSWSGNTLAQRIPVWAVLSTAAPVRFDGSMAMVLGPEAPNPFGMAVAQGETRAFVSLWARGAAQSGNLDLKPLVSGPLPVTMRLVAWLRACEEEVVLAERSTQLDVAPAAAELVLGTKAGRADLTHVQDIPDHNRRVEFGDVRFRLTALSDGTEIITRDGTDLRLSPTGRFLLVDGAEVIDVMDGATVADVRGAAFWAAGDSFLFGAEQPWGVTDIASTFGARELVEDQITGGSASGAAPDELHLSLDLENSLISLRGVAGYWIGPIQGGPYARETAGNGYASSRGWSDSVQLIMMRGLAPVAPVSLAIGYSLPAARPVGPLLRDTAKPFAPDAGAEGLVVASLFRGTATEAVSAFERIGLRLAVGDPSRDLIDPISSIEELQAAFEPNSPRPAALIAALQEVGGPMGWEFELLPEPGANYNSSDCFHYLRSDAAYSEAESTEQTVFATPGKLPLPDFMQQIAVIEGEGTALLIGRMDCQSGATGGSLRGQSYLFVTEFSPGAQPADVFGGVVLESSYMGNDVTAGFQDHTFSARRFGTLLVLFAPGFGRAMVYDLAERRIVHEWGDLPSGNLLMDAVLTEDFRHFVQMNTDGGFHVHRVADGAMVLSGRIVDDEIAVWTEEYRFDATAEAAALIDLRFPGLDGQFSLDRFDAVLHAPGLVSEVLAGQRLPPVPVPVPPDLKGTITLEAGRIIAEAHLDPARQARELRLYQDGILTQTTEVQAGAREISLSAARLAGTRHASLLAVNAVGLASLPVTVDLGTEIPGGTRRALAVAVDTYSHAGLTDLNYAKADADRFMQLMSNLPPSVPGFAPAQFIGGRRAAPGDVLTEIDKMLEGLGAADHAVLFFAGHGLQDGKGDFYFAMAGTDPADLPGTALAWSDVAARLAGSAARITVLIDACHSGSAGIDGFATNDGAVAGLSAVPSSLTILAASKGRQQSIEARSQGGGLFTVALERVLLTERDLHDSNGNGRIEASELAEGLRRIVSAQSEGLQVPWMTKGRIVGDHALF